MVQTDGNSTRTVSLASILADNLVSFKTPIPTSGDNISDFLTSASRLQKLCLGGGSPIDFSSGAGMPSPLLEFTLMRGLYDIKFTKPWDLPRVTDLFLESIDLVRYLRYVPGSAFPGLKKFTIWETGAARNEPSLFQQLATFIEKLNPLRQLIFGAYHDLTITSKAIAKNTEEL
jgi:hypothetical protein